jgi:mRNA interferase MazF
MQPFQRPSDEDISAAYAQGKEAVIALFQGTLGQLAARVQALEDWISKNNPALLDEMKPAGEDLPDPDEQPGSLRQDAKTAAQKGGVRRIIHQGDVYWVPLEEPDGSGPGYTHPHVIIQNDVFNRSRIRTVVVCALTSNRKRANAPGNVLLEVGEANLPRQSVVEVSKISTVDKTQIGAYIGSLTGQRIDQILAGMQFLQTLTEPRAAGDEK